MLDLDRFKKLEDKNIYVAQDIDPNTSIFKYTELFNLLMLSRNQFYVGAKKNFSDKLESGEEFFILNSDFTIAGEPLPESQVIRSKQFRQEIKKTKDWLTACWTLKKEEDFFMWKTYAPGPFSVGIETTIQDLLDTFDFDDYNIFVNKINYEGTRKCIKDITDYAFYKYNFYKGEEELRIYFLPTVRHTIETDKNGKETDIYLKLKSPLPIKSLLLSPFLRPASKIKLKELLEQQFKIGSSLIYSSRISLNI